jgi:aminoglycoside phosphotransferase (APT) family kinase protein
MAGLSAEVRDLGLVSSGFMRWWVQTHPDDRDVAISELRTNPSSGFSSESLLVDVSASRAGARVVDELVLRMPPAGGGLFPEYDLHRQALTQDLLRCAGTPAPSPALFEGDERWIGTPFMVMPYVAGRIPGDYSYPRKGWLHDADHALQRAHSDGFIDALVHLATIDVDALDVGFLHRAAGPGLMAEIDWWSDFLAWAMDGDRHPVMSDAYRWATETAPPDLDPPSLVWGDARFANTVYAPDGTVIGLLDWEQAAIGPAELDIGFWLASRRQSGEAVGVHTDPELPGFPARDEVLARFEAGLGRSLRAIEWHETFAMIRMGTCIISTQALLRRAGRLDHPFLQAPPLPAWSIATIEGK